jgi:hypothetical protein
MVGEVIGNLLLDLLIMRLERVLIVMFGEGVGTRLERDCDDFRWDIGVILFFHLLTKPLFT